MSEMRHAARHARVIGKMRASLSHAISSALAAPGEPMLVLSTRDQSERLLELGTELVGRFASGLQLTVELYEGAGLSGVVVKSGRGDGGPPVEDGS